MSDFVNFTLWKCYIMFKRRDDNLPEFDVIITDTLPAGSAKEKYDRPFLRHTPYIFILITPPWNHWLSPGIIVKFCLRIFSYPALMKTFTLKLIPCNSVFWILIRSVYISSVNFFTHTHKIGIPLLYYTDLKM